MPTSRSLIPALLLALGAALLAGCSSTPINAPAPVEDKMPGSAGGLSAGSGVGAGQVSESGVATVNTSKLPTADDADPASRTVYFDYDSYIVKDEYRGVIDRNAKRLAASPGAKMTAEGHTDARGGTEYNLALGQRRADSVARALKVLGVREDQVESVSFGAERPAVQGSDETAYAKNRRVELKDRR
jgi:peptidoglycan-associated lipoprotein